MKEKTTDIQLKEAADLLAGHLRTINLGANLAKIAEEHKTKRHPFSLDVVSLTALVKDVTLIKSLPMSAKRDNLLAQMESYLNDEPLYKELVREGETKKAILVDENWGLTQKNLQLTADNKELQSSISSFRRMYSSLEEYSESLERELSTYKDLFSKYQQFEGIENASLSLRIGKYSVMLVKL